MVNFQVTGNFWVDKEGFATFFTNIQKNNQALFPHKLNIESYENFMYNLKRWSGQKSITLYQFLGIFLAVYQETGGKFESISEIGSKDYFANTAYGYKARGRGYIQVTWDYNYRKVLNALGYNYDALTSEELDILFLENEKVAFGAVRIMLLEESLLAKAFRELSQGRFASFGTRLNGSSSYGNLLENRANFILKALNGKKLQNSLFLRNKRVIYRSILIGLACVGVGMVIYSIRNNKE